MKKTNAAFQPQLIDCVNVFRHEYDLPRLTYVPILLVIGLGGHERQNRCPVWWRDGHPAALLWYAAVGDQAKSKQVYKES